jgi:DNA-directed RNA polymerase specialized sigma24 family protein
MLWNDFDEPDEPDEQDERAAIFINLSGPEQEALDRFYSRGQSPDEICSEMGISCDQFQSLKRYTKAHFDRLGTVQWAPFPARVPFCMN